MIPSELKQDVKLGPETLITVETLNSLIKSKMKNLRLLDTAWYMPNEPLKGEAEYYKETIPGSVYFDIDKVADHRLELPHMLPSQEEFIVYMKEMHLHKDDFIVCFDHLGMFSSPRAWFTFKVYGCPNVKVLNGGLKAWKDAHYPIEPGNLKRFEDDSGSYEFVKDTAKILTMSQINEIVPKIVSKEIIHYILDARSPGRFIGKVAEPRPGLRAGSIKGSINIPFTDLITEDKAYMKSVDELQKYFASKEIDINKNITASCGSGLTACIILLALNRLGAKNITLYDGSWSEYVFSLIIIGIVS